MKQLLTLTLLFTITNGYSQNKRLLVAGKSTDEIYTIQYHSDGYSPVLVGLKKPNTDTLDLTDTKYKFIKIDGKTYEIKRNTELKEVKTNWTSVLQGLVIKTDSSLNIRYYKKPATL